MSPFRTGRQDTRESVHYDELMSPTTALSRQIADIVIVYISILEGGCQQKILAVEVFDKVNGQTIG
jgi:hypothetical protein